VTSKPVIPRERAQQDIDAIIAHYLDGAGESVALGFVDALEQAFRHVAQHPASGSARYAHDLGLPGLRFWPLRRYPHLVFYVERADHVEVWRVLHGKRDIPAWLRVPEQGG